MADFLADGNATASVEFVQWCAADDMLGMAELLHRHPERYELDDIIAVDAGNLAEVRAEAEHLYAVAYAAWQASTGQEPTPCPAYPATIENMRMQKEWAWPFDIKPFWWRDDLLKSSD